MSNFVNVGFIMRQTNAVAHELVKTTTSSSSFCVFDDIPGWNVDAWYLVISRVGNKPDRLTGFYGLAWLVDRPRLFRKHV